MKLKYKIILILIIPWLISILIMGGSAYFYIEKEMTDNLQNEVENIVAYSSEKMDIILNESINNLKILSNLNIFRDYINLKSYELIEESEIKRKEILSIFQGFIQIRNDYVFISFVDKDDYVIKKCKVEFYKPTSLDFFATTKIFNDIYISKAYFNQSINEFILTLIYDLKNQKDVMKNNSFVRVDISLSTLIHKLEKFKVIKGSNILIKDLKTDKLISNIKENSDSQSSITSSSVELPFTGWSIQTILNQEELSKRFENVNYKLGAILVLVSVFVLGIIAVLSKIFTFPINKIIQLINEFAYSNKKKKVLFTKEVNDFGVEFQSIAEALEGMIDEIIIFNEREKELARLETFSAVSRKVAHDIRSPLTALNILIKQSLVHIDESSRNIIRNQIDRISDIANGLLLKEKAHKITTDQDCENDLKVEMVASILDEILTEKRLEFRSKLNIVISGNIFQEIGYGVFSKINTSDLKCIISNLINNSVEAIKNQQGHIELNLIDLNGDFFKIQVKDNGPGIPKHILNKVGTVGFSYGKENFKNSGNGLGVSQAKTIIERWNGKFSIESIENVTTKIEILLRKEKQPVWFLPRLDIKNISKVVVLDDDLGIHQVWDKYFKNCVLHSNIVHISNPNDFNNWVDMNLKDIDHTLFLCDYELIGFRESGLDLIDENFIKHAVLVTSHYRNYEIQKKCIKSNIKLIPKDLVAMVPLKYE